jgi:hypothetical protein
MAYDKIDDEKQSTSSSAGHFDRHGGAPVQYEAHHPIKEVQGFDKCH